MKDFIMNDYIYKDLCSALKANIRFDFDDFFTNVGYISQELSNDNFDKNEDDTKALDDFLAGFNVFPDKNLERKKDLESKVDNDNCPNDNYLNADRCLSTKWEKLKNLIVNHNGTVIYEFDQDGYMYVPIDRGW